MAIGFARGALAGAAGTTALNAATYADMAVRGRGTSSAPQDLVEAVAGKANFSIPGPGEQHDNRVAGLGPLAGTAVGVAVGAVGGVLHRALHKVGLSLPAPIAVLGLAAAAMSLSDVPLKLLGISDPKDWSAKDWAADVGPHLVYGLVTYSALSAMDDT
jgi:hypothetical protein